MTSKQMGFYVEFELVEAFERSEDNGKLFQINGARN